MVIVTMILAIVYLYRSSNGSGEAVIHSNYIEDSKEEKADRTSNHEEKSGEESLWIAVHVSGAVQYPDRVYYLALGSRVEEAIKAAGGITEEADLSMLNLAAEVKDGQKIKVPVFGESAGEDTEGEGENKEIPLTNINLATKIELQKLPGIGEAYAERILEYRSRQGEFQKIEDIMKVKGIGEKIFENIKELITVK